MQDRPPRIATTRIPRGEVKSRVAWFAELDWLIACDARASVAEMIEEGWPKEAAIDAVRTTYATWVTSHIVDAVKFACDWWTLPSPSPPPSAR